MTEKRYEQKSLRNGPVKLDGDRRIERCADCSKVRECVHKGRWVHSGPIMDGCPLDDYRPGCSVCGENFSTEEKRDHHEMDMHGV